jgi:hypothetical protein
MCRVILLHIDHSRRSRLPRTRPCASARLTEPSSDPIRFSCLDYIPLLNQRIAMIRPIRATILDPILIYREPAIHGYASMMVCLIEGLVNMIRANPESDLQEDVCVVAWASCPCVSRASRPWRQSRDGPATHGRSRPCYEVVRGRTTYEGNSLGHPRPAITEVVRQDL